MVRTALLILVTACPMSFAHAQTDTSAAHTAKRFAEAMQSLPFHQCRYTATQGWATVDEKTHTIRWRSKATTERRYVVDGDFEAYEQFGSARPDVSKGTRSEGKINFVREEGFAAEKHIRGAAGDGRWMDVFSNLIIDTAKRRGHELAVTTPLNYLSDFRGGRGVADMLTKQVGPDGEKVIVRDLGIRNVFGRRCVGHKVEFPSNKSAEYFFDIERGYMPIWIESVQHFEKERKVFRMVIPTARELSGGRWFPERTIMYDAGKPESFVQEFVVTSVEADRRPTRDELSITLPAGTHVFESAENRGFHLRQDEKLSGHDIPELFQKAALNPAKTKKPMDTAIEHRPAGKSLWFWLLGVGGMLFILFGGYRWYRTRPSAAPAGSP